MNEITELENLVIVNEELVSKLFILEGLFNEVNTHGPSKQLMVTVENLFPDCISEYSPTSTFTVENSFTNYEYALESFSNILNSILEFIIKNFSKILLVIIPLILGFLASWLNKAGDSGSSSSSSYSTAEDKVKASKDPFTKAHVQELIKILNEPLPSDEDLNKLATTLPDGLLKEFIVKYKNTKYESANILRQEYFQPADDVKHSKGPKAVDLQLLECNSKSNPKAGKTFYYQDNIDFTGQHVLDILEQMCVDIKSVRNSYVTIFDKKAEQKHIEEAIKGDGHNSGLKSIMDKGYQFFSKSRKGIYDNLASRGGYLPNSSFLYQGLTPTLKIVEDPRYFWRTEVIGDAIIKGDKVTPYFDPSDHPEKDIKTICESPNLFDDFDLKENARSLRQKANEWARSADKIKDDVHKVISDYQVIFAQIKEDTAAGHGAGVNSSNYVYPDGTNDSLTVADVRNGLRSCGYLIAVQDGFILTSGVLIDIKRVSDRLAYLSSLKEDYELSKARGDLVYEQLRLEYAKYRLEKEL